MLEQLYQIATGVTVLAAWAVMSLSTLAALYIVTNFIRLGGLRAAMIRLNAYNSKENN